jgi:hypothetical protein
MRNPQLLEFDQLPTSERLVLITLRVRLDDHQGVACIETMYRIACGLAWMERAVAAFEAMVSTLHAGGRRAFHTQDLTAARVTADEHCLLALLAAHQLGHRAHTDVRAAWLVRPAFRQVLQHAAGSFAHTLARSECVLSGSWVYPHPPVYPPADSRSALPCAGNRETYATLSGSRSAEEASG